MNNSIGALAVAQQLLELFKKEIGKETYDKIMNEPIKGCKCGYIKEGDTNLCPKCETLKEEVKE